MESEAVEEVGMEVAEEWKEWEEEEEDSEVET